MTADRFDGESGASERGPDGPSASDHHRINRTFRKAIRRGQKTAAPRTARQGMDGVPRVARRLVTVDPPRARSHESVVDQGHRRDDVLKRAKSALSNSRTIACIQAGNVPMPARRSSRRTFPCRRSFRIAESCARIRSRSVGRVFLSQRSACTIRIAGRPAQYSLLGAVCLNSIARLSRWIVRRRASV